MSESSSCAPLIASPAPPHHSQEDAGCRRACQFHSSPRAAPPALLSAPPRLELNWDGAEARWSLSGAPDGQPDSSVVFLLLAATADGWKELVQVSCRRVPQRRLLQCTSAYSPCQPPSHVPPATAGCRRVTPGLSQCQSPLLRRLTS